MKQSTAVRHLKRMLRRFTDEDFTTTSEDRALVVAINALTPDAEPRKRRPLAGHLCPHCNADLYDVGVITHSRAHQTANFTIDGVQDFDDTQIDAADAVECRECSGSLEVK